MSRKNEKRNNKIRELRLDGWSIPRISKELGCNKSTVSYHCKDLPRLTDEQVAIINKQNAMAASIKNKEKWERKRNIIKESAIEEWDTIKEDPQMMLFLGLYWGEGRKSQQVAIANGDPKIIKISYDFFIQLTDKSITCTVKYYDDHDPTKLKNFWSSLLPKAKMMMRKVTDPRSGKGKRKLEFGIADLRVCDYKLEHRIMSWIECLRNSN